MNLLNYIGTDRRLSELKPKVVIPFHPAIRSLSRDVSIASTMNELVPEQLLPENLFKRIRNIGDLRISSKLQIMCPNADNIKFTSKVTSLEYSLKNVYNRDAEDIIYLMECECRQQYFVEYGC
ncbi:hypothetical protein GJ496_002529 [Pomphorhynchus laevis]|nr:hypothetical protein GJ496_002529 [Pomphorhynchus laevis]